MPVSADQIEAARQRAEEARRQREEEINSHIEAIKGVRADLETKIVELQLHCERLQQAARRLQTGDGAEAQYRIYGTAHQRLAGAMGQALKRSQATDRLLQARREADQERELRERQEQVRERVKAAVKDVFDLQLPRDDDFEALFGGEGVAHAS